MDAKAIKQEFRKQFPQAAQPIVVCAPGRVNLIGEHTDYNDGYVLPMAVNSRMLFAGSLRDDREVHLYSLNFQQKSVFNLDDIKIAKKATWSNYIRGVCTMFQEFTHLHGMNLALEGNIPQGAGLSSSAALEVGVALLIRNLHHLDTSLVDLVKISQRAENEFVGVQCGIMDQFISMFGAKDHVLFLDCRSLNYRLVPAPFDQTDTSVVVVDSGVKRGLVDSEYNMRRKQCNQAVAELQKELPQIKALRDVCIEHMDLIDNLAPALAKRARHVVTENQRVLDAVRLLKSGQIAEFGELMYQSHQSLSDDYEVSCRELDLLVELARSVPGTLGSRMTGAGFGGCTVSLVENTALDRFKTKIMSEYPQQTKYQPQIFIYTPSHGAHQV